MKTCRMRFPFFLLSLAILFQSACKTDLEEKLSDEESISVSKANDELESLMPNLEVRYLGSFAKENPNDSFFTVDETKLLFQELWQSFAGKSDEFKFLYCEGSSFYPQTKVIKECSSVLSFQETTVQFSFISYDIQKGKTCYLGDSGCKIHQIVTIKAANDGMQRPPVFIHRTPVGEKVLLMTNRLLQPKNPGFYGFLTKFFFAKDIFAPIVVTPYNFPLPFGDELGTLFQSCNTRVMNLVDLSNRALKYYQDYRKPVVLSGIAGNAAMNTAMIMFGMSAPMRFQTAMLANKNLMAAGAKTSVEAIKLRMMPLVMARDGIFFAAESGGFIPYVVSDVLNLQNNLDHYIKGTPTRNAMEMTIFLANSLSAAGLSQISYNAVKVTSKHWKLMAVMLSSLAVAGSKSCVKNGPDSCEGRTPMSDTTVAGLSKFLSEGNAPAAKKALCMMQVDAGLRKTCSVEPAKESLCKR
ncbi:MAG: hypothetical protein WCI18_07260 [Pseudomonadota bacterium]